MNPRLIIYFVALFSISFLSCNLDWFDKDPTDEEPQSELQKFSSTDYGSVEASSGESISVVPGTVPTDGQGNVAEVTFTIETNVAAPQALRNGGTFVGNLVKFGPEYFTFNWPVTLAIPYDDAQNPHELYVMGYDYGEEKWIVFPKVGIDAESKKIYFNSKQLGVFGLAELSEDFRDLDWADGGIRFSESSREYFYTISIAERTNMKYPQQLNWSGAAADRCILGSTGSQNNKPLATTWVYAFQADYKLWITRQKVGSFGQLPGPLETYSIPVSCSLTEPCVCNLSATTFPNQDLCSPWVTITLPSGGTWQEGTGSIPCWGAPTVTYGTGDFQATLNWINNNSHSTDLDLHLYGPNGIHVYYDAQVSSDGSIALDRDWLSYPGNATENIYSLKDMPAGSYEIKVKLYGGDPVSFNVRVIRYGQVKNYSGHLQSEDEEVVVDSFTL
jgi:hypothetical protein